MKRVYSVVHFVRYNWASIILNQEWIEASKNTGTLILACANEALSRSLSFGILIPIRDMGRKLEEDTTV